MEQGVLSGLEEGHLHGSQLGTRWRGPEVKKAALVLVVGGMLALAAAVGALAAVRHRGAENDQRLASELRLLLAAPLPAGWEVHDGGIRGGGACLRPFGCESAAASVRFSVPEGVDPCSGVEHLVDTWPVLVERTYDCNVVGSVGGTHLTIGARRTDPVTGGAALVVTT